MTIVLHLLDSCKWEWLDSGFSNGITCSVFVSPSRTRTHTPLSTFIQLVYTECNLRMKGRLCEEKRKCCVWNYSVIFHCYVYIQFVCHEAHENSIIDMNSNPSGGYKVHRLLFGFLFCIVCTKCKSYIELTQRGEFMHWPDILLALSYM